MKPNLFSKNVLIFISSCFLIICNSRCSESGKEAKASPAYQAEIDAWHAERIKRLTKRTGWLSLSGLFWLSDGENSFGSDPANKINFPAGRAPRSIGTIILDKGHITTKINEGLAVFSQDTMVSEIEMQTDAGGNPTILQLDSLSWFIIKREQQYGVRLRDSESQRLKDFAGIDRFPVDSTWRIRARLETHDPPKKIEVPNIIGSVEHSNSPGVLIFDIGGNTYRLDPLGEPGDTTLFLIFADQTNGSETYGAGRFLYVNTPGADGATVIDFNKAYNPPCAFTPYATCPLPPRENVLPVAVTAGEKKYGQHE